MFSKKSRIVAASLAALTMGAIAVPSASAAETRVEDSALKAPQPLTLQVSAGPSYNITNSVFKAVPLALYTYASVDNKNTADKTDDVITAYDVTSTQQMATAIDASLKAAGIDTSTTGPSGLKYDASNPVPWLVDNVLDSKDSPWAGKLRDFFDQLKHTDAFKAAINSGTLLTVNGSKATANVTPGVYAIVDTTASGRASIISMNGTGIDGITKLKGTAADSPAYTLGTVDYKAHDTSVNKQIIGTSASNGGGDVWNDSVIADVAVGDTISFELSSTVPNWTGYDKYYFALNDTYSKGLTLDESSVRAQIKDSAGRWNDLTKGTTWDITNKADGKFTVRFGNSSGDIIPSKDTFAVDSDVRVTYNMKLDKDAASFKPETNTVEVEYSRNPNVWTDHEKVEGPVTEVYTGAFDVLKTDMDNKPLSGAEFELYRKGDDANPVKLIEVSDGVYRTADATESANAITKFISGANGRVTINGVYGEYKVKETKSPFNMALLPSFGMSVTMLRPVRTTTATPIYTFVQDSNKMTSMENGSSTGAYYKVLNARNLFQMPKTGATWLVIAGAACVLAGLGAAGLFLASRKRD